VGAHREVSSLLSPAVDDPEIPGVPAGVAVAVAGAPLVRGRLGVICAPSASGPTVAPNTLRTTVATVSRSSSGATPTRLAIAVSTPRTSAMRWNAISSRSCGGGFLPMGYCANFFNTLRRSF
jgi:hypothetical protein